MASITSAGIGSGLDVNSIVTQLVSAERSAADTRLSKAQTKAQTSISALGQLSSLLGQLNSAAKALRDGTSATGAGGVLGALTATSSNSDLFSASATSKAVPGSYNIEVMSLAQADKRSSQLFASSGATVGTGTVTIGVGSKSFTVTLDSSANTLADLRDKINAASDNSGVGAAIVSDAGGARLLLTSRDTGTANALTVTSSLLTTSSAQAATDAVVKVDGFTTTSSSNQVTTAVDGLTLNLAKAQPGTTATLNVALDQGASSNAVQTFVNAYNNVVKFIGQQTAYNPDTKSAGTLLGDAATRGAQQQLRSILGGSVSGAGSYSTFSQLGITTATDGTLTLDSAKLNTAIGSDFDSVKKLLAGTGGIATRVAALTTQLTDTDNGLLTAETKGYQAQIKDIGKQQDALDVRMTAYESRVRAQFTALDTVMSKLKSTSDYLTQQLASLTKTTSGN